MHGRYLTAAQLADRLGVALRTIYDWNYRGTGPRYLRTGTENGPVRYPLAWVEEWERGREVSRAGSA